MSVKKEISAATRMRQLLLRHWIGRLPTEEFAVTCFVYERTYPFNKTEEAIPVEHFLNGVTGNGFRQEGLPFGRTKLMEVLRRLESKGAIFRRHRTGRSTIYGLNHDWRGEPDRRKAGYPQDAVDISVGNSLCADSTCPGTPTRRIRTSEHRTSEFDNRIEGVIVDGAGPSAAAPSLHQQKLNTSHLRQAGHDRAQSSRGGS